MTFSLSLSLLTIPNDDVIPLACWFCSLQLESLHDRSTEFIRVFYYLRRGYKAASFMVCMIVDETFKRLIRRMNDRLDVTVSWEGQNPRPGDCRLMLSRLLSFYLVLSPFLFSWRFSHSLSSLFLPPVGFSSSCLLLSSLRITFRLPFRWFREARNCFPKRRRRGSLIRGFTRTNYRQISHTIINLNIPLPLDILPTHANHVGWQMCIYE